MHGSIINNFNMLHEVRLAQKFLKDRFGEYKPFPGVYAVPIGTSKGKAFMRVVLADDFTLNDFSLFQDEELTKSWHA